MSTRSLFGIAAVLATAAMVNPVTVLAWDYTGHRIVNQAALSALPADFPAFVHEPAAVERVGFLAGEPDRWRNVPDLPIRHANGIDHYLDVEQVPAAGLDVATLRHFATISSRRLRRGAPRTRIVFPRLIPRRMSITPASGRGLHRGPSPNSTGN